MASDFMMAGYTVYEALAVSEVLYLCEHTRSKRLWSRLTWNIPT